MVISILVPATAPALAYGGTGGASVPALPPEPLTSEPAQLAPDGSTAIAPVTAPQQVKDAIASANQLTRKPYRYGGGHRTFRDTAYDCSGSVSYALHGARLLGRPLASSALSRWGLPGRGAWITVFTNPSHAFLVIAGLRFDTAGPGPRGPRWRSSDRLTRGFTMRHPASL
jgi:hypothetical protein